MPDKKGGPTPDDIMAPSDMKPLLKLSKSEPVSCVVAMTKDKDGVMLLDKKIKPKQLTSELKKKAEKAKLELDTSSVRFGNAVVDADTDATLVKLVLNKDAPGAMRAKLLEHLKKAGYAKIDLTVDEGLEAETGDGKTAEPATASPPPAPPPPPPPDTRALTARLAQMIKDIPKAAGGDATLQASLAKSAAAAQASLKAGDLAGASATIDALGKALQAAPAAPPPQPQTAPAQPQREKGPMVVFQTARLEWEAARKKVQREIAAFRTAALAEFDDDEDAAEVAGALDQLDEVLLNFDDSLTDKLDDILTAKDDAARQKGIGEARKILAGYIGYINANPLVVQLEGDTPLGVSLSIRSTLVGTLKTIGANLH